MTSIDAPANVTGIDVDTVPDVAAAVDILSVGNGAPNLFDALIQRVNDWTSPSVSVDDSDLITSAPATATSGILLMSTDLQGTPCVVGQVYFQCDFLMIIS